MKPPSTRAEVFERNRFAWDAAGRFVSLVPDETDDDVRAEILILRAHLAIEVELGELIKRGPPHRAQSKTALRRMGFARRAAVVVEMEIPGAPPWLGDALDELNGLRKTIHNTEKGNLLGAVEAYARRLEEHDEIPTVRRLDGDGNPVTDPIKVAEHPIAMLAVNVLAQLGR